jgi:hypothetical protein
LAWVGVTCGPNGNSSSLYITNQTTGARITLGAYFGRNSDDGIAWSNDGKLLAVEDGPTIAVVRAGQSIRAGQVLDSPAGCTVTNPAFLPTRNQIAAVRTCYGAKGHEVSSALLAYDSTTGRPVALVVEALPMGTIQSVSVDTSGHVLVGVSNGIGGAETAQVRNGRLVTVSKSSPTGAQW